MTAGIEVIAAFLQRLRLSKFSRGGEKRKREASDFKFCPQSITHILHEAANAFKQKMICIDMEYLEALRSQEVDAVRPFMPEGGRILDFGAGPGHQALRLQQMGFRVTAVDLSDSSYRSERVFTVSDYDGKRLPYPDASFDVVYSSNVLEHVKDLDGTLHEMQRVLRPDGHMLHVLPSATWRLWSWLAEFASAPRNALRCLRADASTLKFKHALPRPLAAVAEMGMRLVRPFFILPHGETGTALSELYTFSRHAWTRKFRKLEFDIAEIRPLKLFYTGEMLLGPWLSFERRRGLARFMGSSTILWVISRKREVAGPLNLTNESADDIARLAANHPPRRRFDHRTVTQQGSLTSAMKVMFVIRSMARGGAQRQLSVLARGLAERGHSVTVAVFYGGEVFEGELKAAGIRVIDLGKKSRWDNFGFYLRLCKAVREERPDVLHPYLPTANALCSILRFAGLTVPVVLSVRASNMTVAPLNWLTYASLLVERQCARTARAVIVNSKAGQRHLRLDGGRNKIVAVVDNGIDTQRFRSDAQARIETRKRLCVSDDTLLVGLVARLDPMKDHRTFLHAAALVLEQKPDVRFLCVGSSNASDLQELTRLSSLLGLDHSLTWLGDEPDMLGIYNALDLLCLSSAYGEGFPNVLAEAMSCGTPCVATDVGDSARVVGESERVVPPRDPERLARAMVRVLEEDDSGKEHRISRMRESYSVEQLVSRTERILAIAAGRSGET